MCDVDKLTSQLLELSKQLATLSKSFRVKLRTKEINFTRCSQDVPHPAQDEIHPGALSTAKKKKTKSPSQKKRDFERRKLFLLKKLETTEQNLLKKTILLMELMNPKNLTSVKSVI